MREAWVLLRKGAGEVTEDRSVKAALNFGAKAEKNCGVGGVLARAAGVRLRWEAWMVFIWVT